MDEEAKLLVGSIIVVVAGLLVASVTETLTGTSLKFAALFGFGAPIVWWLSKMGYLKKARERFEEKTGGTEGFKDSRDFKEMWETLQEWEEKDPRNTELVWHPVHTRWNTDTLPHTTDVDFLFVSIVTPFKYNGKPVKKFPLHICFEAKTGFIIKHDGAKWIEELKGDPFEKVPLVKNARNQVYSTQQMMSRLRSQSVGRINVSSQAPLESVDAMSSRSIEAGDGSE